MGAALPWSGSRAEPPPAADATSVTNAAPARANASNKGEVRDLTRLSLEELLNYPITTVSRKEEKLSTAAAAVDVITDDDLRRWGVTTIPDALRLVPGMEVARVDAHDWAVSARGFNDYFSNKLLVLMDGRSVYTPLFSGVFWDVQDTLLEDIDRIEVIRGPGATMWGANAVNGVINILTKPANETQGTLIMGGAGTEELGFGGVRYGGKINDDAYYRVYVKYFDRDHSMQPDGLPANDSWDEYRGGFRLDWAPSEVNSVTFQGDAYEGRMNQTFFVATPTPPFSQALPDETHASGGNLLSRWTRTFSETSQLTVQTYFDRTDLRTDILDEERNTFDFDLQHRFQIGDINDFQWGGGYRVSADHLDNTFTATLNPASRTLQLFSAFVQDEITLVPDKLWFTAGSKFEHNDFTGFEIQPSGRISYAPASWQTVWGAVSRAVRTPSRVEEDLRLNQLTAHPGVIASIVGNPDFESEKLNAFELGDRFQIQKQLSFDVASFYNQYDDLRSLEPAGPLDLAAPPPIYFPAILENKLHGETYGVEVGPTWQPLDWWRIRGAYTFLEEHLLRDPGSLDFTTPLTAGQNPQNQFSLISSMDLPQNIQFDWDIRYVDHLPALAIPSYATLDVRLGWVPIKNLEFSIAGRNLIQSRHPEFTPTYLSFPATEVERSVYGKITWRF